MRVWPLTALGVAILAAGLVAAALLAWPAGAVGASPTGLATVSLPGFSGHVERITVQGPRGKRLPFEIRDGTIWPQVQLPAGARMTVTIDVRRPGWIGWLVGSHEERTVTVLTPVARIRSTLLRPKRRSAVAVRFAEPVSRVAIGRPRPRNLRQASSVVLLGVVASGRATTGTTTVAAAARPWEKLSEPVRVSWFVPGARTRVVSEPAAGGRLRPDTALTLTFAQPVSEVLGSRLPRLVPVVRGHWQQLDSHTLSFQPSGFGFGLGGTVRARLPGRTLTWRAAGGSTLRLQQLLARLGY